MAALALSVALLLAAPFVGRATAEPAPALAGLTTIGVDVALHPSQESARRPVRGANLRPRSSSYSTKPSPIFSTPTDAEPTAPPRA
jgi:hypothetical protein